MSTPVAAAVRSASRTFSALGGKVAIEATGELAGPAADQAEAAVMDLQHRLTRFEPESELCRLNADHRTSIPASNVMLRFAGLVAWAGQLAHGLVDATCLDAVERAGYTRSLGAEPVPGALTAPAGWGRAADPHPGGADPRSRWRQVSVDPLRSRVVRPRGVRLDSGGLGKGLAADLGAEALAGTDTWAVSCVGDLRLGGLAQLEREIVVDSPLPGQAPIARLRLAEGAVATSGVTRRSWIDPDGRAAHHLIDPLSGRPADTGVLQVTAIAPTGVEAEVRAKAALLAGPDAAKEWLVHGGVVSLEHGRTTAFGSQVELTGSDGER
jgi:thiamine biosynthesis lipoprotein